MSKWTKSASLADKHAVTELLNKLYRENDEANQATEAETVHSTNRSTRTVRFDKMGTLERHTTGTPRK